MTTEALWQLCIYADMDIHKYHYLFDQFSTNIFSFTDYNMSVHHNIAKVNKEKADQMKMIVDKLMNKLKEALIGGELLPDFEKESIR